MDYMTEDYTKSYTSFKAELDMELNKAADGFVKIGYLLKVARDTDVLGSSGYKTVAEFAQTEYGLTKDIVSRYIAINDRYSEGGYAPSLASKYQNFGLAKLAEMLTLPDNIVEAIPDDITKEEIREIKREYAEEQKVSDIEIFEERAEVEAELNKQDIYINDIKPDNPMKHIIYDFLKDNPDEYIKFKDFMITGEGVYDILAPSGSRIITSRIPGKGRYMLSITGSTEPVVVASMREPSESYKYTLDELAEYISLFIPTVADLEIHKLCYEKLFNIPWPKQEESENSIDTRPETASEEKKPEKKPEKKKVSKVTVIKKKEEVAPVQHENKENLQEERAGELEENSNIVNEEQKNTGIDNTIRGYKAAVTNYLNRLRNLWESDNSEKIGIMLDIMVDLKSELEEIQKKIREDYE